MLAFAYAPLEPILIEAPFLPAVKLAPDLEKLIERPLHIFMRLLNLISIPFLTQK